MSNRSCIDFICLLLFASTVPPPDKADPHASSWQSSELYGEDSSVYSSIEASEGKRGLIAKTLMEELETEAPLLSKDLKIKIVKAILEEDPNTGIEKMPQGDSDEGRAI